MKNFFTLTLPPLAALLLTTSCQAAPQKQAALTLAQNGKSAYVIALAADAIPAEKTAANELQSSLEQISGAKLPIQNESAVAETAPQIVVGASTRAKKLVGAQLKKMGKDGIVIQTVGRNLILAGDRPRGTLYAVGEFLQSLGVRHWTPTESTIPQQKHAASTRAECGLHAAVFLSRTLHDERAARRAVRDENARKRKSSNAGRGARRTLHDHRFRSHLR